MTFLASFARLVSAALFTLGFTLLTLLGMIIVARLLVMPAAAHGWYTGKTNPVTGQACCNRTDCWEVTDVDVHPAGPVYMVNVGGYMYSIDRKQILASEDHKYHACVWGGELKCFFVPLSF